jgi:Co/Zn/Cd efflux system component
MSDDDDLPKDLSDIRAAYCRTLWIVVVLNVGYGLIELVGGFLADSQALKADAIDLLGTA